MGSWVGSGAEAPGAGQELWPVGSFVGRVSRIREQSAFIPGGALQRVGSFSLSQSFHAHRSFCSWQCTPVGRELPSQSVVPCAPCAREVWSCVRGIAYRQRPKPCPFAGAAPLSKQETLLQSTAGNSQLDFEPAITATWNRLPCLWEQLPVNGVLACFQQGHQMRIMAVAAVLPNPEGRKDAFPGSFNMLPPNGSYWISPTHFLF